jgi:hypothetical protein
MFINFDKNGLGYILGHLLTNSSGHTGRKQGDPNGRIFTHWVIFSLRQVLKMREIAKIFVLATS